MTKRQSSGGEREESESASVRLPSWIVAIFAADGLRGTLLGGPLQEGLSCDILSAMGNEKCRSQTGEELTCLRVPRPRLTG
jgi:hypothetical protein